MDSTELKRRFDEVDRTRNFILFTGLAVLWLAAFFLERATKESPTPGIDIVSIGIAAGIVALLTGLAVSIYRAKRVVMIQLGMQCDQCGYVAAPGVAFSDLETAACSRCGHVRSKMQNQAAHAEC